MQANFLSASIILAWLVTPESLRMVNIGTGFAGIYYIISLSLGAALALLCARQIYKPELHKAQYITDYSVLRQVIGKMLSLAVILSGRVPLLLFASTGLLVTAGFAFNEIFLYWFPNFLFASILLIFIVLLNTLNERMALSFQAVFVTITLVGMLMLIVMGLEKGTSVNIEFAGVSKGLSFSLISLGFVSFLGFDFYRPGRNNGVIFFAVVLGLIVLSLWSFTAINHVSQNQLAQSTIAHLFVARAVAGELGRYIMGTVVIFGVASGVNGLFIVVRRIFSELAQEQILPKFLQKDWVIALIFGITIEAMMMTGVAGEEILETKIYASIMLWLFYLGIRIIATAFIQYKINFRKGGFSYFTGLTIFFVMGLLALTDLEVMYIFKFLLGALVGTLLLSFVLTKVYNKKSLNI